MPQNLSLLGSLAPDLFWCGDLALHMSMLVAEHGRHLVSCKWGQFALVLPVIAIPIMTAASSADDTVAEHRLSGIISANCMCFAVVVLQADDVASWRGER